MAEALHERDSSLAGHRFEAVNVGARLWGSAEKHGGASYAAPGCEEIYKETWFGTWHMASAN
jgi:hypothetical protein